MVCGFYRSSPTQTHCPYTSTMYIWLISKLYVWVVTTHWLQTMWPSLTPFTNLGYHVSNTNPLPVRKQISRHSNMLFISINAHVKYCFLNKCINLRSNKRFKELKIWYITLSFNNKSTPRKPSTFYLNRFQNSLINGRKQQCLCELYTSNV